MATRHADIDARKTRVYFIESVALIVEVHKAQSCVPEWIQSLEAVNNLKRF